MADLLWLLAEGHEIVVNAPRSAAAGAFPECLSLSLGIHTGTIAEPVGVVGPKMATELLPVEHNWP